MPPFGPVKGKNFVRYLGQLGFAGPYTEGKHQFMQSKAVGPGPKLDT